MRDNEIERINYDYFIMDGDIVRPLGVGDNRTHFMKYNLYGDWTLNGKAYNLNISDLLPLLKEDFYRIKLSDIAWKGFDLDMSVRCENCPCCNGHRFRECDTTTPGILLDCDPIPGNTLSDCTYIENPGGRKYRCLDGKHRIEALLSYEREYGIFYVVTMSDIEKHLIEL